MTPQAEGSYFGHKHLEQVITSYLHFTENRPSQAKATLVGGGSGTSWSSWSSSCGVGRSTGVVAPDALSPRVEGPLLSVWTIKFLSI